MRCINCDAMVTQAPSNEKMSIDQIDNFISSSIEQYKQWKHIRILGGEPTTHKDFLNIVKILINYKNSYSPNTVIQVVANGYGDFVNKKLKELPCDIQVENSNKTSNYQPSFSQINNAPIDKKAHNYDYSTGCWITSLCGIALDSSGFYPCSVAASIDRVACFGDGIKKLSDCSQETMNSLLSKYCCYCGHYKNRINYIASKDIINDDDVDDLEELHKRKTPIFLNKTESKYQQAVISTTWNKFLNDYKRSRPKRKRY